MPCELLTLQERRHSRPQAEGIRLMYRLMGWLMYRLASWDALFDSAVASTPWWYWAELYGL